MRLTAAALALTFAAGLAGCGGSGNKAPTAGPTAEELKAAQAALPAPYNTADAEHGRSLFGQCRSCHTIIPGGANLTGPNLHGVVGRQAAAVEGFNYSAALKASGIVWDAARLDAFVANPRAVTPGTKMSFAGLKDAQDRLDLVAYLMLETAPRP